MTIINRDTFIQTGEVYSQTLKNGFVYSYTPGTIEVTLRGQTRRVEAKVFDSGMISVGGLVGRYQSATKLWPASVTSFFRDGKVYESANFGRDDRDPKFRKENHIWFAN